MGLAKLARGGMSKGGIANEARYPKGAWQPLGASVRAGGTAAAPMAAGALSALEAKGTTVAKVPVAEAAPVTPSTVMDDKNPIQAQETPTVPSDMASDANTLKPQLPQPEGVDGDQKKAKSTSSK
jgi:hypothetical protein